MVQLGLFGSFLFFLAAWVALYWFGKAALFRGVCLFLAAMFFASTGLGATVTGKAQEIAQAVVNVTTQW